MPYKIKKVEALEILDSRGNPTVEAHIELSGGIRAKAAAPSGASTGRFEAHELRDGDFQRYGGKGVLKAVANVNSLINAELQGIEVTEQQKIDSHLIELDGTKNKTKLGANAILAVSLAAAKAGAQVAGMELYEYFRNLYDSKVKEFHMPTPVVNVINGGAHGDTNINIQEFWVVPQKAASFAEKLRQASEIFHKLGQYIHGLGMDIDLGNEGGYSPDANNHKQLFEALMHATEQCELTPGDDIVFGIDAGASEFFDSEIGKYVLSLERMEMGPHKLMDYYFDLMELYPLRFIEDPFEQEDWNAWIQFMDDHMIKDYNVKIIGDDLFVTNKHRLLQGIERKAANGIIIKPNQIGTLTETLEAVRLAKLHKMDVIVSHRSGETDDTTIADLAVGVNAEHIKTGSTARGERIAKYNRLLNIEKKLNGN